MERQTYYTGNTDYIYLFKEWRKAGYKVQRSWGRAGSILLEGDTGEGVVEWALFQYANGEYLDGGSRAGRI